MHLKKRYDEGWYLNKYQLFPLQNWTTANSGCCLGEMNFTGSSVTGSE